MNYNNNITSRNLLMKIVCIPIESKLEISS
jgi:hypothetical protein